MSYDLDQIKAISIPAVAHRLGIEVNRSGKALCFTGHDKKTPSLSFNVSENYFNCFGCGIGGSSIDLVMAVRGASFADAARWPRIAGTVSS